MRRLLGVLSGDVTRVTAQTQSIQLSHNCSTAMQDLEMDVAFPFFFSIIAGPCDGLVLVTYVVHFPCESFANVPVAVVKIYRC